MGRCTDTFSQFGRVTVINTSLVPVVILQGGQPHQKISINRWLHKNCEQATPLFLPCCKWGYSHWNGWRGSALMCNSSFCCCQSSEERSQKASRSPVQTCPLWAEIVPRRARSRSLHALRPGRRRFPRCSPGSSSRWMWSCWNRGCAPRRETGTTWAQWRPESRAGWAGRH